MDKRILIKPSAIFHFNALALYFSLPCFTSKEKHIFFLAAFSISQLFFTHSLQAIEQLSINVEKIKSKGWLLTDVRLSLLDLDEQTQQLVLSIGQLILPEPFSEIKLVDVKCRIFNWQDNKITCQKGQAKLKSNIISPSIFSFSFTLTDKLSQFSIKNLILAKGKLSLKAIEDGDNWTVTVQSKNLQLKKINSFLSLTNNTIKGTMNGSVNADIKATGSSAGVKKVLSQFQFNKLSLQSNNDKLAAESLSFKIDLQAKLKNDIWYWNKTTRLQQGGFYIAPVYVDTKGKTINMQARGLMHEESGIEIQKLTLNQADVFELKVGGGIQIRPDFSFDSGYVSADVKDLEVFSRLYLLPFFEGTHYDEIQLQGRFQSEIQVDKSTIKQVSTSFNSFTVNDNKQRISINKAEGEINWSNNSDEVQASHISWNKLKIKAIPIESGELMFLFRQKNIKLLESVSIAVLGGYIDIKQFNWYRATTDEPKVFFEGDIRELSLEQLSEALGWTSLSGKISGYIPGVEYENKTLRLKGELKVSVFDGVIKINKLASSGMFTDFSKFHMDMKVDNLDLHAITQKFKMGGIEGRVSGFVNNLYLENWEPVTFYAWLGTPENDDSTHSISQKAVENIASIGGGGAADIISKGFLRFFDTFGYDKLGFGCYLHHGVCQLMGVEAAEQGYYIIKGGGLPRIDVIGYNPQLDWKVLMQRLSRIFESENVLIN